MRLQKLPKPPQSLPKPPQKRPKASVFSNWLELLVHPASRSRPRFSFAGATSKNRAGMYTRARFFVKVCSCRKSHSRIAELGGGLAQTFVKIVLPCTRELDFCSFSNCLVPVKVFSQTFAKIVLLFKLPGASEGFGAPSLQVPPHVYLRQRGARNGSRMPVPNLLTPRPSQDDGT